tara:strand:- start:183 stop:389 length:207 start_codon:yes stop_codon:yes gene_type:complete
MAITPPVGYIKGERVFNVGIAGWDIEWHPCYLKECPTGNYWHAVDIGKNGDYSGLFTIIKKDEGRVTK